MIDMFDLYNKHNGDVNTHQGGLSRPVMNFQNWCNAINHELFREWFKDWGKSQRITDELAPFLVSVNVVLNKMPGLPYDTFVRPGDYEYFSNAFLLLKNGSDKPCFKAGSKILDGKSGKELAKYQDEDDKAIELAKSGDDVIESTIEKVDNQRWGAVMGHRLKKVDKKSPKMTQVDGQFKVAPKGCGVIVLNYLRLPKPCVFSYTIGSEKQIVYDATNSVPLEWSATMENEFLARLTLRYAKFYGNESLYGQGQIEKKEL